MNRPVNEWPGQACCVGDKNEPPLSHSREWFRGHSPLPGLLRPPWGTRDGREGVFALSVPFSLCAWSTLASHMSKPRHGLKPSQWTLPEPGFSSGRKPLAQRHHPKLQGDSPGGLAQSPHPCNDATPGRMFCLLQSTARMAVGTGTPLLPCSPKEPEGPGGGGPPDRQRLSICTHFLCDLKTAQDKLRY